VTAPARAVTVHELELTAFAGATAAAFRMRCSKGTYVRALARDLGRALGVGGHVTALRRTRSGPFSLAASRPLDQALAALAAGDRGALPLVSPADALRHLDRQAVTDGVARDVRLGRRVSMEAAEVKGDRRICLLDQAGGLVAVAQPRGDGTLQMLRVFVR
jgi:tRNA pseudouridine55 synthase